MKTKIRSKMEMAIFRFVSKQKHTFLDYDEFSSELTDIVFAVLKNTLGITDGEEEMAVNNNN